MNKEILKEYAELKIQGSAIDARLDELKPLVLQDILEAQMDKVPTSYGAFTIKKRKIWTYSPEIGAMEEDLKKHKAIEEADGIAKFTEVPQLEFRQEKKK